MAEPPVATPRGWREGTGWLLNKLTLPEGATQVHLGFKLQDEYVVMVDGPTKQLKLAGIYTTGAEIRTKADVVPVHHHGETSLLFAAPIQEGTRLSIWKTSIRREE